MVSTAMFDGYNEMLTVPELAAMLRIGRNSAYELVRSGAIRSIVIGRQIRIPKASVIDYINRG
jgi:excisionase family DNA binding protein